MISTTAPAGAFERTLIPPLLSTTFPKEMEELRSENSTLKIKMKRLKSEEYRILRRRMIEYVPLEYSYAIYIGDVDEMDEAFATAKENGLTNENLTSEKGTWPRV